MLPNSIRQQKEAKRSETKKKETRANHQNKPGIQPQ